MGRTSLARLLIFPFFICFPAFLIYQQPWAADTANQAQGQTSRITVHGDGWAFGQSADRRAPIWIKGIQGKEITGKPRVKIDNKKAADTSNGIDAALSRAEKKPSASLGMKMKNETSSWKVAPEQASLHPDETIARDGRHVLGAYAGMDAGKDLNINVGPELIIKDEQNVRENSNASQPDTVLGLGMNFKLDF